LIDLFIYLLGIRPSGDFSTIKPKFHLLRHVTTRHYSLYNYSPYAFWYGKKSYTFCVAHAV